MLKVKLDALDTRRLLTLSVVVGILLGVVAVGGFQIANAVEVFMSQFGIFVVLPAMAGFLAPARRTAALAATMLLVSMCLVYYLPYAGSVIGFLINAAVWTVLSLIAGPVFGLAGHALRSDNRRGAIAAGGLIGLLAGEFLRMFQKGLAQGDLEALSLLLVFNAVAVVVIVSLIRPERLARVAIYALPLTALGYLVTYAIR